MTRQEMRAAADRFARAGIDSVRPKHSIAAALEDDAGFWHRCVERGFVLFAFGKASAEMARAVIDHLGPPVDGIVVTHRSSVDPIPGCTTFTASHPVPDHRSLAAGAAITSLAARTRTDVPAVVLISGGASALIECPRPGVHLEDLQLVNEQLLRSGLPIGPMNVIRQALSTFKGGGLATMLGGRPTHTLVISDVVGNDLSTIASGPMSPPRWRQGDPWDACPNALRAAVAPRVRDVLQSARPLFGPEPPIAVVADAQRAAEAALAAAIADGFASQILTARLEGDAAIQARSMLTGAGRGVSISAGETTVVVEGDGSGGRNQHAAVTWATEVDDPAASFVGIAIGTDGRDGPTDAAGGLVDGGTAARVRAAGGDPDQLLANDDSHRALALAGDLIAAEPTGTNVGDLWIIVR